jgi:hypothetical protein
MLSEGVTSIWQFVTVVDVQPVLVVARASVAMAATTRALPRSIKASPMRPSRLTNRFPAACVTRPPLRPPLPSRRSYLSGLGRDPRPRPKPSSYFPAFFAARPETGL